MEEGAQTTIYDDFKFLTKEDLERLNLTNLIGTNLLRAYMHGFFIDYRLYKKVMASCFVLIFFEICTSTPFYGFHLLGKILYLRIRV